MPRSADTYTWMFLRAVRGGEPSHSASARTSTDTSEFALHSKPASTICCLRGPASTESPCASIRTGPRILKRNSGRRPPCCKGAMLGDFYQVHRVPALTQRGKRVEDHSLFLCRAPRPPGTILLFPGACYLLILHTCEWRSRQPCRSCPEKIQPEAESSRRRGFNYFGLKKKMRSLLVISYVLSQF